MRLRTIWFMRISLAIIYVWFGGLKIIHVSPAEGLVKATTDFMAIEQMSIWLGFVEVVIGLGFLIPKLTRPVVFVFLGHMVCTVTPFVVAPETCFNPEAPAGLGLSLVGQYIIKNLALVGCALGIWCYDADRRAGLGDDGVPVLRDQPGWGAPEEVGTQK